MSESKNGRLEAAETLIRAGSIGAAVGALRTLVAERPEDASAQELLATALEASGDRVGAEAALRAALRLDPMAAGAATKLATILSARREWPEAIARLEPFVGTPSADLQLLTAYGAALKMTGRLDDAAEAYRRATQAAPASGVAEHNLAAVLGDAQRFAESDAAAQRAFAKGLDAPE
ncbi:MAG TPA: tetratricopeptide repeat protein, partial [Caulobacteraceae bacterium]